MWEPILVFGSGIFLWKIADCRALYVTPINSAVCFMFVIVMLFASIGEPYEL